MPWRFGSLAAAGGLGAGGGLQCSSGVTCLQQGHAAVVGGFGGAERITGSGEPGLARSKAAAASLKRPARKAVWPSLSNCWG